MSPHALIQNRPKRRLLGQWTCMSSTSLDVSKLLFKMIISMYTLQKRVAIADLKLLHSRRTCLLGWPLAGACELRFLECSHCSLTDKGGYLYLNCATLLFMQSTCFPSGSLEFWNLLVGKCLCDKIKTLGVASLMGFLGQKHPCVAVFLLLWNDFLFGFSFPWLLVRLSIFSYV